jgi:hypothetical protein
VSFSFIIFSFFFVAIAKSSFPITRMALSSFAMSWLLLLSLRLLSL